MSANGRAFKNLALMLALALIAASSAYAAKGVPGPPGGEEAINNLSFPVLFPAGARTIPGDVPQGQSALGGTYYLWDGDPNVLPCLPNDSTCTQKLHRVYVQKDPANDWQANWLASVGTTPVSHIDVGDNLESVPWRTTSPVRVEFVPFGTAASMIGFEMVYVSGQGMDEVWGAKAPNVETPKAVTFVPGFATLYSDSMALSLTKLEQGPGSISTAPNVAAYSWNSASKTWVRADSTAVAHTERVTLTAEINVKGKLIYGYNWSVSRIPLASGVTSDGWWRVTFFSKDTSSPLDFTSTTLTYDPLAGEETHEDLTPLAIHTAELYPTYPRKAVVDPGNDLVYIDVYIRSGAGNGGGGNGGGRRP